MEILDIMMVDIIIKTIPFFQIIMIMVEATMVILQDQVVILIENQQIQNIFQEMVEVEGEVIQILKHQKLHSILNQH